MMNFLISLHNNLLILLENGLSNSYFISFATLLSLSLKTYIFYRLTSHSFKHKIEKSIYLLLFVLIGAMMEDIAWLCYLMRPLFSTQNYTFYATSRLLIQMSWAFYALECQSLVLFLESLVTKKNSFNIRQKISIAISSTFAIFFIVTSLINISSLTPPLIRLHAEAALAFYSIFFLMGSSLVVIIKSLKHSLLPRLLRRQLNLIIQFLLIPKLFSDFIQYFPFNFFPGYASTTFSVIGISTLLLTFALLYCARKVIGLRFLNLKGHVQSSKQFNFIDGFKEVLEQLSKASTLQELGHITQTLFKEAFSIPLGRTTLSIRSANTEINGYKKELSREEFITETFFNTQTPEVQDFVRQQKILILDEIDFSNFYESNETTQTVVQFLEAINADIFLPIYKNNTIIAYIIVDRYARLDEFYSEIERDEMLVFASYLANVINLLQNRNFETLIYQEKELKEELYKKHQEINQYKESIRSFLKNTKQKDIGIIFYKQRRFIFANQTARELIPININQQEGHPISRALKSIAHRVQEYRSPQSTIVKDDKGNKLVLSGVLNIEQNNVIITVHHPDFVDIISEHISHLKDPSKWDYLLYLETTKPGQLINQLIPGNSEMLLSLKIELLQAALSKKALLLNMPEEDLMPTTEIIHHISMRQTLKILNLKHTGNAVDIGTKIFGINPIFGIDSQKEKPLLETLDGNGTLCIKNIEHLSLDIQEQLAHYIRYGYYKAYKSDERIYSNVRIICSTHSDLHALVQDEKFSPMLFAELKQTAINMPSLLTLTPSELEQLAQGYSAQTIEGNDFKNLLELNTKDVQKLVSHKPTSLLELKERVHDLLAQKAKNNNIDHEVHIDQSHQTTDPELIAAARLGKHALRDHKIMTLLWNTFKSQNKIATFLGVNRSSVNRRCKEYHLEE